MSKVQLIDCLTYRVL